MNREICDHGNPADIPCDQCGKKDVPAHVYRRYLRIISELPTKEGITWIPTAGQTAVNIAKEALTNPRFTVGAAAPAPTEEGMFDIDRDQQCRKRVSRQQVGGWAYCHKAKGHSGDCNANGYSEPPLRESAGRDFAQQMYDCIQNMPGAISEEWAVRFYEERLNTFAESRLSQVRRETIEECAKAVCGWCARPERYPIKHRNDLWYHLLETSDALDPVTKCAASAIRSLAAEEEGKSGVREVMEELSAAHDVHPSLDDESKRKV